MDRNTEVATVQLTNEPAVTICSPSKALDQGPANVHGRLADMSLSGQEKFVEEINKDRYHALRLKNSLLPLHQMPPEIHAFILHLSPAFDWYEHYKQLHTYAQVSCLWRSAVLNTPILWSRISSDMNPQLCVTALARSRDCPLTVELRAFHDNSDIFSLIVGAVRRWGSIYISWYANQDLRALQSALEQPMPHLRSAALSFEGTPSSPVNLSAGQPELLKSLPIGGMVFSWDSSILLCLKSLTMSFIHNHTPTWPLLHNILQNAVRLESLLMSGTVDISNLSTSFRHHAPAPISLPSFRSLTLSGAAPLLLRNILEVFHLPNLGTCHVDLNMKGNSFRDIFTPAADHMLPVFGTMVSTCEEVVIRMGYYECKILPSANKNSCYQKFLTIVLYGLTNYHEFSKWIARMGIDEKSPRAVTLELGRPHNPAADQIDTSNDPFESRELKTKETWDAIKSDVDHLPMVTKLRLELLWANIDPLLVHLTASYDSGTRTGAFEKWPLPRLQELSIVDDSFTPDCLAGLLNRLALLFVEDLPGDITEEITQLLGREFSYYGLAGKAVDHVEASSSRVSQWSQIRRALRFS